METSNPVLKKERFGAQGRTLAAGEVMTIEGAINKTLFLLFLSLAPAMYTWSLFFSSGNPQSVMPWTMLGAIGGLVVAMVTVFKSEWSAITAPLYALLEGLFLGGFSAMIQARFPDIPIILHAVALTFGVLLVMLTAYRAGWIRLTDKMRMGIAAATGAVFVLYLVSFIMGFFGSSIPFIHSNGLFGIGFSLFVVGLAAFNLVLDFELIERGAREGAPKYMEWYGAFALLVTLIWLYIEIVRLLAKLNSRD